MRGMSSHEMFCGQTKQTQVLSQGYWGATEIYTPNNYMLNSH